MKKGLRRKLIMSAVAVGAAAVGTTASTYAWFVTSNNVSSTVSGEVESSGASLFISKDGQDYGTKSVTPTADFSNLKMAPLQMKSENNKLYDLKDNEKSENVDYMKFTLYFSVQNLNVAKNDYSIKLSTTAKDLDENKTKTHEAQTALASDSTYEEITQGKSLWDNVLKTMNVGISQEYSSENTFSGATTAPKFYALNKSAAIYDGLSYFNKITGNNKSESGTVTIENDALTTTSLETKENVTTKAIISATGDLVIVPTITGNGYYKIDFTIWLDGWNKACFDAVASHTFSLGLKFSLITTPKNQ